MNILQTKLTIPPPRKPIVKRTRILELLDQCLSQTHRIALLSALPGSGKTTLLADWLETQEDSRAWISLDAADNDPIRFLSYLISSLVYHHAIGSPIGEELLSMLQTPSGVPLESVLIDLIHELSKLSQDFILVLDDYHVIENPDIHAAINFFIDNLPPNAFVVISTRSDPPFPLADLRAKGQIVEIRSSDLRFNLPESKTFLNDTMGLQLTADEVAGLEKRTEGWVVGLQLAGSSLHSQANIPEFIENFSGSNRFLIDYLVEEVLRSESDERYSFLLTTSILDRITGPLCNALTKRTDGQTTLEALEHDNFFVVPLDQERRWYRYHPLFSDFLRHRLAEEPSEMIFELHLSASQWYKQNGQLEDAVEHLILALAYDEAAALIETAVMPMLQRGRQFTVERWIESIPETVRSRHPQLLLLYAWVLLFTGRVDQFDLPLKEAERIWVADGRQDQLGKILAFRANVARLQREPTLAIDLAQKALDWLSADSHLHRGVSVMVLGDAHLQIGKVLHAQTFLQRVLKQEHGEDNQLLLLIANNRLADAALMQGHLHRAAEIYQDVSTSVGKRPIWQKVEALIGLGQIHLEWNQLQDAENHLSKALAIGKQTNREVYLTEGYLTLAWLYHAQGEHEQAIRTMNRAVQLAKQFEHQNTIRRVYAQQARMRLQQGDQEFAMHWLEKHAPDPEAFLDDYLYEAEFIAAANIYHSSGELSSAERIISSIKSQVTAGGRFGALIELIILESLVQFQQEQREAAVDTLKDALVLAEPSGYIRVFANEGRILVQLLQQLNNRRFMPNYVQILLQSCRTMNAPIFSEPQLIEPLTEREIEVLSLMSQGTTNQEIAAELTIALTTSKKHVSNILGKLGVKNRTEAVSRARELDLI